jgi:hypothetical protein
MDSILLPFTGGRISNENKHLDLAFFKWSITLILGKNKVKTRFNTIVGHATGYQGTSDGHFTKLT